MNLTLLLDLDDTLLDTNLDAFLPVYFEAFSGFLKEDVEPELMLSALLSGTRKMMANNDPSLTLRHRITSYNVCYTKLLRKAKPSKIQIEEEK